MVYYFWALSERYVKSLTINISSREILAFTDSLIGWVFYDE